MTDKVQKIKEEIERLYKHYLDAQEFDSGYNIALDAILQFINSLPEEPASEDLKEEIDKCWEGWIDPNPEVKGVGGYLSKDEFSAYARHFAEWQKQKDFEDFIKSDMTMPNKFYEKGRFDMREEMMKNAIECVVEDWCGDSPEITIPLNPQDFKTDDKVKIVICKTEQQ